MTPPRATLRVLRQPHLGPGVVRYEVACPYSSTGLTHVPSPRLALPGDILVPVAGTAREERCGCCCVEDVLARGDQELRRLVDEVWPRVQAAMLARAGRWNRCHGRPVRGWRR